MSVQLTPSHTLGFRRPLTQLVKRTLAVTNPNDTPVAFKVKTTAPKLYCVRPNSGRVEPGETVEVQVMLQAMKEEPPLAAKCKDKFLIQSTFITSEKDALPLQEIWSSTDETDEMSRVHQQKVKVAYLAAEGTIDEEDEPTGAGMSSMLSVDDAKYATVRPNLDGNGHAGVPEFSKSGDALTDHEGDAPHTPPEQPAAPPPPVAAAPAPVPQVSPPAPPAQPAVVVVPVTPASPKAAAPSSGVSADEHADLLARLAEAQAELQRMRALLQSMPDPSLGGSAPEPSIAPSGSVTEVGLRRRNRALSDASSTMAGSYAGGARSDSTMDRDDRMYKLDAPEGVPLPIVIGVTLGVFVMTYLFF